jgi:hypothetical protein
MSRVTRFVAWTGIFCLAVVPHASADPITITGLLTASKQVAPADRASLSGPRGFSVEARVNHGEGNAHPLNQCDPCLPGTPLSIGGILSGAVFAGIATLDGITYTDIQSLDAPAGIYLEFFGSVITPTIQDVSTLVAAPFTMLGIFSVQSSGGSVRLRGAGTATVRLRPEFDTFGDPPVWLAETVRYDFSEPNPVPEPATLVMVAGGLLAVARSARRRRRLATAAR